ncbi:sigma-70 family RNA polymerase sigma factor [Paenibacillus urinalis]|uniref:Sigma-70 family RNA polymerase sigma factor n=1 Tax=Paenibacillus urinalis TaxID=521520 RepID=A0ABY7XAF8_9BACL|nr:sigma-70 family RNA polymerase sigma factor [Paenibacillus urinalis]WDH99088.1 sigma-70 family RNA polymerase sigma factor [Paenibacillus urinalis]WDI02778.1 sigma-70 family RNA polymerase sigma factor [Paenibacillus urinalis]
MRSDMDLYLQMEDSELSIAACQGDIEAYEELVRRHGKELYAWSYIYSREEQVRRRLLIESISKSWCQRNKLKDEAQLVKLLFRTMYITARKQYRATAWNKISYSPSTVQDETTSQMTRDTDRLLSQKMNSLPFEERTMLQASYILAKMPAEFGKFTGIGEMRAAASLQQAKQMMKESSPSLNTFFEKDRMTVYAHEHENLEDALQQGLTDARAGRFSKRLRRTWGAAGVVVIGIAIILVVGLDSWGGKGIHDPLNRAGTRVVPDDSYWLSTVSSDRVAERRLQEGDAQYLGYVAEQGGLKLIIDGMMTQGDSTLIWYTLTAKNGQVMPDKLSGYMYGSHSFNLSDTLRTRSGNEIVQTENPSTIQGMMIFDSLHDIVHQTVPEEWVVIFNAADAERPESVISLSLTVPSVPSQAHELITVNQEFELNHRSFMIKQAELTENYTKIVIEPESRQEEDAALLRSLRLRLGSNDQSYLGLNGQSMNYETDEEGRTTLIYPPVYYLDYSGLSLVKDAGLVTITEEFKVDLDEGKLVGYPDHFNGDFKMKRSGDGSEMKLYFKDAGYINEEVLSSLEGVPNGQLVFDFYDAEGNYYASSGTGYEGEWRTYYIQDGDYPQPITIPVVYEKLDEETLNIPLL